MNGPTNPAPPASAAGDALGLLTLLADKDRAAEVIGQYDRAKSAAEEAQAKLAEQAESTKAGMSQMLEHAKDLEAREAKLATDVAELARKRDGDLREIEGQRAATTAQAREMTDRKVAFEHEWASADANQRSRTAALDERERLLVTREETTKAKEVALVTDRETYERDRAALDARQSNLRKLLEQG